MNAIAACYSVECERYPLLFVTVRGDLLTCASGNCHHQRESFAVSKPLLWLAIEIESGEKLTRVGCGYLLSRLPAVCFANRWHRNYSHGPNRADEDREEDYRVLVCCILLSDSIWWVWLLEVEKRWCQYQIALPESYSS